tara:strand:- start:83 stop:424 length:342 start_codon:yes stop_codon:yes gene_type:complete
MIVNKTKDNRSTTINTSIITNLKDQALITDETLVAINAISLENLIAVKLELACNHINNRLYGFDIWRNSIYIVKDALLKFAISTTRSKKDAARFLGLTYADFRLACKKFDIDI